MSLAHDLLSFGLIAWLALLGGHILLKLLDGTINTKGVFSSTNKETGPSVDPERLLAALAVLVVLGGYALEVIQTEAVPNADGVLSLPDIPESLLAILAASNGTYLAGKIVRSN